MIRSYHPNMHSWFSFNTVIGDNSFAPKGIVLKVVLQFFQSFQIQLFQAGKNYKIESANAVTGDFVFYAVSIKARKLTAQNCISFVSNVQQTQCAG